MHNFYFNECLPVAAVSTNDLVQLLIKTINEYESLVKKNKGVDRNIILASETEKINICDSNLKNVILSIPDKNREARALAFSYFTKYPIQNHLQSVDFDDKILEEEYQFETLDATNLAVASFNNCFLFTVAVADSIKKNSLQLAGKTEQLTIDNLFGETPNTLYIETQIDKINAKGLELFEQLKASLKNPIYAQTFEKAFKSESIDVQESIIYNFTEAPKRELATPYFPDNRKGGLIKDVTPDHNSKKAKVYELRVYSPVALRVYFFELNEKIYLSSIGYKNEYKKKNSAQSKDINRALINIDKLIKTNI